MDWPADAAPRLPAAQLAIHATHRVVLHAAQPAVIRDVQLAAHAGGIHSHGVQDPQPPECRSRMFCHSDL